MTAGIPGVLANPVGVIVAMISGIEPALELAVIEEVVIGVAGGRAKRRKLAQALARRPAILADGRSPAPRAAGDLLVALRKAGAGRVSPPACAGCGKQLRSFQRRGEDWFCSACGPKREPCAGCGKARVIHLRDRDGRPRCAKCPPGGDPVAIVTGIVAAIDPGLPGRDRGGNAVGAASSARLGLAGPARAADRGRGRGTGPVGAAADRPAGQPAPRASSGRSARTAAGCPPRQAPRRGPALPQLRGQVPGRAVLPLRGRPRGSDPRQGRPAAVSALPDHRPGQPGDLRRLRSPAAGQRPHARRPALPQLPPLADRGLRYLRQTGPVRDLAGHRRAMVRGLQAAPGTLLGMRPGRPRPGRHQGRAALRDLHPFRCRLLDQLPGLRRNRPDPRRPVRPVRHQPPAA